MPIGQPKGPGAQKPSRYARPIAERFRHDLGTKDNVPDAMDVYRRALAEAPDGSVVIVTVGYLTNIADLLKLPAKGDQPSGLELARKKVKRWVCMGGNFVGQPPSDDLKLSNNNFTYDKAAAHFAVRNWPGSLTFVGREIGSVPSGLKVGRRLKELPERHPVRVGYSLWFGGEPNDRHVADQTAVLFAVRGAGDFWDLETNGFMDIQPDSKFTWRDDPESKQSHVRKKAGRSHDREVERAIEELMMRLPAMHRE